MVNAPTAIERAIRFFFPPSVEAAYAGPVNGLILAGLLLGLVCALLTAGKLRSERVNLRAAVADAGQWRNRATQALERSPALQTVPRNWLEARLFDLARGARTREESRANASWHHSRIESMRSFVILRHLSGTLILLGLAGTLLGLSSSVLALRDFFTAAGASIDDSARLVAAVLEAIGGMQTAFSTTLAGVLGTLILSVPVAALGRSASALSTELDQFTVAVLSPILRPAPEVSAARAATRMESLEEHFKRLCIAFESSVARVDALLGASQEGQSLAAYIAELERTVESIQSALDRDHELAEKIRSEIVEGSNTAAALFGEAVKVAADGIAAAVESQTEPLTKLGEALELHRAALKRAEPVIGSLSALAERLDQFLPELRSAAAAVADSAKAEEAGAAAMATSAAELSRMIPELRHASDQLSMAAAASQEFRDVLDAALDRLGRAMTTVAHGPYRDPFADSHESS